MARYLLAASPIPGHVLPLATVAGELRRRGHRVRLLTGARFREFAIEHGVPAAELPRAADVRPVASRAGRGLGRRLRIGRAELSSIFLAPLTAQYTALSSELARGHFDAVLVDSMFSGAIPLLVSDAPRPPVLVCGVGPLTLSSADCPPFGVGWQPRAGRDYTRMNRFVHHVLFRPSQARLNAILAELGMPPAPVFLLDWPILADRILQFTVPGFEYPRRDLPSTVVFTGPIPASADGFEASPDWKSVGDHRRVVHLTQGTWDNGDPDQLLRPALAALARRPDLVVVVSTGGKDASLGPLPAHIHVRDFVPYAELLPHVDLVITNGGYGGVHHALRHGIPVIVAGGTADKPEVAARVAYTGAGIDLGGAAPAPAAVAAAVDRVFGDTGYRVAARRLAREIAQHKPFDTIESVLADTTTGVRPRGEAL
ncbi:glycosyltransferase [Nocardia nova]|uniref:glycosyltransferase n=1 Tax=Nocardia nova TaxID=37330 RepID=UPI001C47B11D|nr:nucleotide disphospho-sugar-binding domain-containing protein [Nocardia nova]MBV7701348.1 glycosyltransferase [Nocardia nova]